MFSFVLQSLTSLLLTGILVYAVFASERLRSRKLVQQALLGLIFGVTVVLLGMDAVLIDPFSAPFDARSGPLIFAGYLGGPIGAVIAGTFGALYRIFLGGPTTVVGVFMNLAIPVIGVAVGYLRPQRNWPAIENSAIGYLILGFSALHLPAFLYFTNISQSPTPYPTLVLTTMGFIASGILAILVTWQILKYAFHFATQNNQSADLTEKLNLAMQTSGMGMFDYKKGDPGPIFDAGLMAIYGFDRKPGIVPFSVWTPHVHPDDLARILKAMKQTWDGEKTQNRLDFRLLRPNGSYRHIRAVFVAQMDVDGTVKRVTGTNTDMTDIREAEQRHQVSQDRLAVIVEKLPGVLLEMDATAPDRPMLKYLSAKCQDIWGYSEEEFFADPLLFVKMHDPDDIGDFLEHISKCIETGEPIFHRYMITARDGQTRWLDYHGSSSTENGKVLVKAIVLDATSEVEAQKLMEAEREISRRAQKHESIGQLTGGVAHDFNNLLAVILGNLELLRDEDLPSNQTQMIDAAITASLRGAELTKNMLAFARKAPLTPVTLDLNNVVREAKNWMARALPASVVVETSLLAGLWSIEADRASLESALLNLSLNARDAMKGHGNLTIETANVRIDEAYIDARQEELIPGRYVMLAVSDTGPGIPDDTIGSIFEPFFTTKPPGLGSGLGLSMTVGFMRQSGGTVQVYTEIGEGTTFKLYFPASVIDGERLSTPIHASKIASITGQRLLLAEDEDAVRETLVTILERAGYQVTATPSGDAAYAAFQADPTFDLLLTDIVMPGKLQGTDLATALREQWPTLPVLFMSGYASEATVHGNGLRTKDIRLMKPVQRTELIAAVGKAISDSKE